MEWYEVLLLIIATLLVISILLVFGNRKRNKNIKKKIKKVVTNQFPNVEITTYKSQMIYQLEFETNKAFLIKIIDMNPRSEIIITNSEKVVVNDDIKGWKRSTKPNFVSGIKEFINIESEMELVKIVLIYPNCYNITKYINESDAFIVDKHQKIDGVFYLRYEELEEFLKKV